MDHPAPTPGSAVIYGRPAINGCVRRRQRGAYGMPLSFTRAARVTALRVAALVILAACGGRSPIPAPAPPAPTRSPFVSGEGVVTAMHDRYAGRWYNSVTFRQKTSRLLPNGTWDVQTWYEAIKLPGRLRIDFDPVTAGNGVLYARDTQYVASNNRIVRASPGTNDLLLLGFDVYGNTPTRTSTLLRRQGFDMSRVHMDTFQGRPMIVVGALQGDLRRKQFWVDADRMLFTRLLEAAPRDSLQTQDIRFLNYEKRGDAWISPRVEIYIGDKLIFSEDYSDIRTNVLLDESLFNPTTWKNAKHWTREPAR